MNRIAIVSLKGGVGRTTIAANLGRMLAERSRTFVLDLDPQNALGLHFGMPLDDTVGISDPALTAERLLQFLRERAPDVPYIPFGARTAAELRALDGVLATDVNWLKRRIKRLCPEDCDFLIIDTPAGRSAWVEQAIAVADLVLVVLTPDGLSYALVPATEELLVNRRTSPGNRGARYLINQIDASRELSRDVRESYHNILPQQILDIPLYTDEAVREAVARRQTVAQYAPHSQFTMAIRELADWVLGTFS